MVHEKHLPFRVFITFLHVALCSFQKRVQVVGGKEESICMSWRSVPSRRSTVTSSFASFYRFALLLAAVRADQEAFP